LFLTVRRADNIIKKYNDAQEAVTEKIRGVAFHDHLTGLPNRVLFVDRLEHAIDVATRSDKLVALMFIDLDRFKQVNDNLGHEAGDKLLCQFSSRLLEVVRPSDTVSRISGDEFTIILENLSNIEFSTIVSQRILSRMEAPFLVGKNKIFITCSIGLSIYPFNDDDVESLIKKADAAMFFSKSFGRNTFHYYSPDMLEHGSQRYELEIELNTALKEQQFYLVFQPKIDLINWTMQGVETQIHWNHPDKGFIEPEIFMPMLEETGLIIHVGEWVLRESCRLSKQWQNEGLPPIRIAVNISSIQLNHPDFLDMVSSILNSTNLEPKYLELELSERRLIDDQDNNIKNMKTLRDKGIHLTIDDFGTGFSSLSYLSKLPIETLKINKSFITDMMSDTQKRSITTAIISFAHSLKLNIIVDGIETREQLMFITAMRCSLAQGSLISNYLDYDEFYEVYKSGGDFSRLIENRPTST
jgi:diguanylate cyclase (GGDEF)-like protein